MKSIADFIIALIRAIFGIVTLPLRILGVQPKPTAAAVADAAVEAIREHPLPVVPPPAPREPTPMADLVVAHARKRLYTHEQHPALAPLPPALEAWISQLDGQRLGDVIGAGATVHLQRHINAGLQGSTVLGPYRLPPVVATAVPLPAQKGSSASGGGPARSQDLNAVLAELGLEFGPSNSPRPR